MWRRFTFFSEGCAGQNKNNTVIRYLCSLIYARKFAKVVQVFLFLWAFISSLWQRFWINQACYQESRQDLFRGRIHWYDGSGTCTHVTTVKPTDILDFKNWWPKFYKKLSTSVDKQKWSPSRYKKLVYSTDTRGAVTVYESIDGLISTQFGLVKSARTAVKHTMKNAYGEAGVGNRGSNRVARVCLHELSFLLLLCFLLTNVVLFCCVECFSVAFSYMLLLLLLLVFYLSCYCMLHVWVSVCFTKHRLTQVHLENGR